MRKGQTLIVLLVFVAITMLITTAAVTLTIINSQSGMMESQGNLAKTVAESGAENGLLQLLRNPNYTGGVFLVGANSAQVSVSTGGYPKTLISKATVGDFTRTVKIVFTYNSSNVLTVSSWGEEL